MSIVPMALPQSAAQPRDRQGPSVRPHSPELGAQLTSIIRALRARKARKQENQAEELARLRALQRFD